MANQVDMVVIEKQQKKALASNSNIMKKEHEKPDKYKGLKEELEKCGQ